MQGCAGTTVLDQIDEIFLYFVHLSLGFQENDTFAAWSKIIK